MRLLEVVVREGRERYKVPLFSEEKECEGAGYTVLIGPNGVGKSYLLRAITDFFVELEHYAKGSPVELARQRYRIEELKMHDGAQTVTIFHDSKDFWASAGDNRIDIGQIRRPRVIGAHFGLYDRFPLKQNSYDTEGYEYVGAKASGNILSAFNIVSQMAYQLCSDPVASTPKRLIDVFDKLGFNPWLSVGIKVNKQPKISDLGQLMRYAEGLQGGGNTFRLAAANRFMKLGNNEALAFLDHYLTIKSTSRPEVRICLDDDNDFDRNRSLFQHLHMMKQLGLAYKLTYYLYRDGKPVVCTALSSGELNFLASVVSIAASLDDESNLVLLDEPELNQHPNWQMGFASQLDSIIHDFDCHCLMATHSHLMVADMPMGRSAVVSMREDDAKRLVCAMVGGDTYGWSPEQVLVEAFGTATDRNLYLSQMVGSLLDSISRNEIAPAKVNGRLQFLRRVAENLSDIDPMKMIIDELSKALGNG